MKKRIIFNDKIDIPDIVNDKCNMAYEQIRSEAAETKPTRKIRHSKKAVISVVVAAAVLGCAAPVAANYFKNAFDVVHDEVYTKDPGQHINVAEFATDVNIEAKQLCADITMQSVYCDGNNILVSFVLEPINEEMKSATNVYATISAKLNGKFIDCDGDYKHSLGINFSKSDDGLFYGVANFTEVNVTEKTPLEIEISGLRSVDASYVKWVPDNPDNYYGSGNYEAEETIFSDKFNFTSDISADTSNNKLYEVNETNGNYTLESVLVTPFSTEVKIYGITDGNVLNITDNNGNKLEYISTYYISEDNLYSMTSPLKTADKLNIEVLDTYQDGFPVISSFTVDIEKGFAEKYTVEFDDSDKVYDPPLEELQAHWDKIAKDSFFEAVNIVPPLPVGSTYALNGNYIKEDVPELAVKITGSEIGSFSDYSADEFSIWETPKGCENMSEEELKNYVLNDDNFKLMLVTYEITSNCFGNNEFYFHGMEIMSKNNEYYFSEPYISVNKENGGVEGNLYSIEGKETKTLTFGYVIPKDMDTDDFYGFNTADNCNYEYIYPGEQVLHEEAYFYALK